MRNPRIQVVLSPETYSTVRELAELQDTSASSLLREMIELITPQLARMASLLREYAAQADQITADVHNAAERAEHSVDAFISLMNGQFDLFEYRAKFGDLAGGDAPPSDDGGERGEAHLLIGALKPLSPTPGDLSATPKSGDR